MIARLALCLGLLCLGWIAGPAHAASFDCAKAGTTLEKTICGDKALSDADGKMGSLYGQLIKALPKGDADRLKQDQRAWLKTRTSFCKDSDARCILPVYQARIGVLEARLANVPKGSSSQGRASSAKTTGGSAGDYTVVSDVNVRTGPSTDFAKVGTLRKGKTVKVTGTAQGGKWYQVSLAGGVTGFVYGDYLKPTQGASTRQSGQQTQQNASTGSRRSTPKQPSQKAQQPATNTQQETTRAQQPQGGTASNTTDPLTQALTQALTQILRETLSPEAQPPASSSNTTPARVDQSSYYRLSTQWQGQGSNLTLDESDFEGYMDSRSDDPSQFWKLSPVGDGSYWLSSYWLGDEYVLDIYFDSDNIARPYMVEVGQGGETWWLTSVGNGYYRLTTSFMGSDYSLDIVNDGVANNQLVMAPSGNYSGQYWYLEPATVQVAAPQPPISVGTPAPPSLSDDALWTLHALRDAAQGYDYDTLSAYSHAGYFEHSLGPWINRDPRVIDVLVETLDEGLSTQGEDCVQDPPFETSGASLVCSVWSDSYGQVYTVELIYTGEFGWMLSSFYAGSGN